MASLNLVPNLAVMATQAGIFLSALMVIKKTMLEPYLRVRAQRLDATVGGIFRAKTIFEKNQATQESILLAIEKAHGDFKLTRDKIRKQTSSSRDEIMHKAEIAAKEIIESARQDIFNELQKEREKIPQIVSALKSDLYAKIMS